MELLDLVFEHNPFHRARLGERPASLADVPLLEKRELVEDQRSSPPFGTNLTFPLASYTHVHQTSGTTGPPLRVLDTSEDWQWWARCLATTYTAAGIGPGDRGGRGAWPPRAPPRGSARATAWRSRSRSVRTCSSGTPATGSNASARCRSRS